MSSAEKTRQLLDGEEMDIAISKMAGTIVSEFGNDRLTDLAVVGIQTHGVPVAERIVAKIGDDTGFKPFAGSLDISMYRDDIGRRKALPLIRETEIPFDIEDKIVVLVDDVLQTGRTIRAALDAITDFGRPSMIRLAVLIDRGGRELPIRADYSGEILDVTSKHSVVVKFEETDGMDEVLEERTI